MRGQQKRRSREFWTALIDEYEESGETAEGFARRKRVNVGTLRSWVYQLRKERRAGQRVRFVEVDSVALASSPTVIGYRRGTS